MIRFALVSAPASEPVTLAEAKAHARIEHDFEDDLIETYITAARRRVEQDTLRALVSQVWSATLDRWPLDCPPEESEDWPFTTSPTNRRIRLARPPIESIDALTVDDVAIAATNYALRGEEAWIKSSVVDSTAELGGGIVIEYTNGYGLAADVPGDLKLAIKMMTAHLYAVRETTSPQGIYHQVAPHGYEALISPYRVLEI